MVALRSSMVSHPRKNSWRVVLAISNPLRRNQLARQLRDLGCRVATAQTGTDLLRKLGSAILDEDASRQPALIIAELGLAGCSGLSVLEGLRALLWDTPFFLIVKENDEAVAKLAFSLGASRVFEEPTDPQEISAATLTCLLARSSQNHSSRPGRLVRGTRGP